MGDFFYKALAEFQEKYPTREEREKVLRSMSADRIMQLVRSSKTVQSACYYARFAQMAMEKEKAGMLGATA